MATLTLEQMNAQARRSQPPQLSLDEMNARLRGTVPPEASAVSALLEPSAVAAARQARAKERAGHRFTAPQTLSPTQLASRTLVAPPLARARWTMADFPAPVALPPAEAELEARRQASEAEKRLPSGHGRPTPQPTLGERFRYNLADAMANTILGATKLMPPRKPDLGVFEEGATTAPELAGSPIANIAASPLAEAIREQSAKDYAAEQAAQAEAVEKYRQREQFPLPAPEGPAQVGAAVAGQLVGGAASPESLIPVTRGATLLETFLRGAKVVGVIGLATDPMIQQAQIDAGLREKMDPVQPFLSGAAGAFLGGTLNVAPEVATKIAQVVGRRIGKAAKAVTNSDVFRAMRTWTQRPELLPKELRIEPTIGEPGVAPSPEKPPAGATGEALVREEPSAAPEQRGYGRESGGLRLERQLRESTDEQIAETEARLNDQRRRLDEQAKALPGPWGPEAAAAMQAEISSLQRNVDADLATVQRERQRRETARPPAETPAAEPPKAPTEPAPEPPAPVAPAEPTPEPAAAAAPAVNKPAPPQAEPWRVPLAEYISSVHGKGWYVSNAPVKWRDADGQPRIKKSTYAALQGQWVAAVERAIAEGKDVPADVRVVYEGGFAPERTRAAPPKAPPKTPELPPGAKLAPSPIRHGDPGTLGKATATTQTGLVNILDRADARRFKPKANALYRQAAEEQWQAFLAQIDQAATASASSHAGRMRLAARERAADAHADGKLRDDFETGFLKGAAEDIAAPSIRNAWSAGIRAGKEWRKANPRPAGEPEFHEVRLQTLRGRETIYRIKNDPKIIGEFRSRFAREADAEKFYSKVPSSVAPISGRAERATLAQMQQRLGAQPAGPVQSAAIQAAAPGAAYVGPVVQTYNPAVPAAKDPLRRESILRAFTKGMGMPIYTGRVKSKRMLGFFRPKVGEVRIKQPGDIETAAHEMAHLLDRTVPEIRRQWFPATKANAAIRQELAGVSYDASKLYEGFAEFVRLWMTQTKKAQAAAPQFYQWFESFVGRSKHGPTLRRAQTEMTNWFEQAALDRGRSKIGPGEDINAGLVSPFNRFRQAVTDDLQAIAAMERQLTGTLSPLGAYETARLTRGKTAIIEGALTMGAPKVNPDGSHSFVGKGLQQILDPVGDRLDDFLMYAVGRSANELMAQGRERLFTAAEIKGMVALETPEFRKAFNEYQAWNKAIVDFAEAKGVIDPAFRATWKRTQYLPFYRVAQGGGTARGQPPGDWRGIRALTGGSENLRPVLGNIIQNAATLIDAALTNEARQKVARLAGRFGGARFMAKIPKDERAVRVSKDEIERAIIEALGVRSVKALPIDMQVMIDQIVTGMRPMTTLFQHAQTPKGRNIVAVLYDGKPTYYEVIDPLLYRSFTALNREPANWLIRALAIPKRIGQATVTLTLDFMARNILRDTVMAGIMSRHGFVPAIDGAKGFKSRLFADQNYREFIANGGGLGSHLLDETAYRKHLERFYTKKGINYRTVLDAPDKLLFGLERIAEAFEQATRLGEFGRAIGRGEHPRHAAYSAREVSTDFAMRGDSAALGFFYDTVIFLKAAVNGMDRMYRGFVEDPNRGGIAAKTALLALMSAGLYAVNRGNPLYEQLEDWDRDTHWHFFVPRPDSYAAWTAGEPPPPIEERYWHFRLPKLWEIGAIGSIAERQVEGIMNGQPGDAQLKMLTILRQQFNLDPIPQAVKPLAELAMNTDIFTGRPVESQADKELLPFARSDAYTSPTLRAFGEDVVRHLPRGAQQHGLFGFPLSPKNIQHLLEGYFNGWAMYGMTLTDAAFFDDAPDLRLDQLPVVRSFYRQEPARQTKWVTELYEAIDAATDARRTMRAMDKRWRPEIAGELAETVENRTYGQLNFADQRMRMFRKEMIDVADAPDLAAALKMAEQRSKTTRNLRLLADAKRARDVGAVKRLLIDDLIRERNAFAETVMKDVEARREELKTTGTGP